MRVQTSMGDFAFDDTGRGRPLVLLHGFPIDRSMWRPLTPPIRDGWRVIAPDLPGFGESTVRAQCSIADLADAVFAVLDAIGVREKIVLGGLSMGGIVCFDAWRRYAHRIAAILLIDTRPNAETAEGRAARYSVALSVEKDGPKVVADSMRGRLFALATPADLQEQWFARISAQPRIGTAACARALGDRADSWPTLATINVPTLIIVGDQDAITPPDLAKEMHTKITGSHLAIINGAGHMPPVEQPSATADAINAFLGYLVA
ncbi:MAG: alpha/beta fold hydrolase [Phycisphaerales bacterium]|jgi:3-oxoadipate enol-lactonase|nr:alpha/beta fold hydrolase [Phycisphaerales bacterium]